MLSPGRGTSCRPNREGLRDGGLTPDEDRLEGSREMSDRCEPGAAGRLTDSARKGLLQEPRDRTRWNGPVPGRLAYGGGRGGFKGMSSSSGVIRGAFAMLEGGERGGPKGSTRARQTTRTGRPVALIRTRLPWRVRSTRPTASRSRRSRATALGFLLSSFARPETSGNGPCSSSTSRSLLR